LVHHGAHAIDHGIEAPEDAKKGEIRDGIVRATPFIPAETVVVEIRTMDVVWIGRKFCERRLPPAWGSGENAERQRSVHLIFCARIVTSER